MAAPKAQGASRLKKIACSRAWGLANPERKREIDKASRGKRQLQCMLRNAKRRAAKVGREFSIELGDLEVPEVCPIFGVPLVFGATGTSCDFSPSLDRIDSSKGYVKGNVQIMSRLANCMKWTATPEQLLAFSLGVLAIYRNSGVPLPVRQLRSDPSETS